MMRGDGSGRVFRYDGGPFWIAYSGPRKDGSWGQIRESAKTKDKRKAERLLETRVRSVRNSLEGKEVFLGAADRTVTVGELFDALERDYRDRDIKSLDSTLLHMKFPREFFAGERAAAVTTDGVRRYREARRAQGRANATINRETELLAAAFRLAVKDGRLVKAPNFPERLPEKNARKGFFETAERDELLARLPAPLDEIVRFGYLSGWRRGEILPLRWERVDRAAREVRLSTSKNGEPRTLPLDAEEWTLFERLWKAREFETAVGVGLSAFVFHRNGKPINKTTFGKQWRRACIAAGLGRRDERGHYSGKLFHDLRRTAARDMIRAGVSQDVAMTITGHETASMFRRYDITSPKDKLDALARRRAYVEDGSNVASFAAGRGGFRGGSEAK